MNRRTALATKTVFLVSGLCLLISTRHASATKPDEQPAKMFDSWCYQEEDSAKAAKSIISELKGKLGNAKPTVIFFAGTSIKLDIPAIVKEVQSAFPDTPIWGATSALGLFMNNDRGYMRGSVVGMLALCSEKHECVVDGASISKDKQDYVAAAAPVIDRAKKHAGGRIPAMILFASNPGPHEEKIMDLLKQAFGSKVPIFGGSSGTEAPNPRFAIANGEAHANGLSLCFIYTSKPIGYCYQMGYKRQNVSGVATDVDGRWIQKIDGRPALEVYNEWTDGFFSDVIKTGKPIRGEGQMYHPLALVKKTRDGAELTIALSAKQHSQETGAIEFFASVNKGDTLTLLKGDTESLLQRAYLGVAKAKRLARGRVAGGLVFCCSGARLLLEKQNRTGEMSPHLRQAFKDRPFILLFNNGEHGCIPGTESFHGNLMLDAVVFGE